MSLEQQLFEHLQNPQYVPSKVDELVNDLRVPASERKLFKDKLRHLVDKGHIACVKRDRYALPSDVNLISGTIKFRQSGAAIIIPSHPHPKFGKGPFDVAAHRTGIAMHGDYVLARISQEVYCRIPRGKDKQKPQKSTSSPYKVRVLRVLKNNNRRIVGTLAKSSHYYFVIPDDPRIVHDIYVPAPRKTKDYEKPELGHKVVVELGDWPNPNRSPEGIIVEVLGFAHTPKAEFEGILRKHDLETEFPEDVMREAYAISQHVEKEQLADREDCRHLTTLTVDPDDAKDFDDALSVEHLENGSIRVGVHIADVSTYVQAGSHLDNEARARGNSTYLVGFVVPMLPEVLSNGICSLVEGKDRLTKSVFLTFSDNHRLTKVDFANTVIRSDKRLTYEQAMAFLRGESDEQIKGMPLPPNYQTGHAGRSLKECSTKEMRVFRETLGELWSIASVLRSKRMDHGSLNFDVPEVKVYLDANGYADHLERKENDASHQMIEEFMLAANEVVAKEFFKYSMPAIHRVHDAPDPERLNELKETLASFGIFPGNLSSRKAVCRFLEMVNEHPQGYLLKIFFLRSLRQACYKAKPEGHYGLNKEHYLHFTSPIRRYSDLVVHRVFDRYLVKVKGASVGGGIPKAYTQGELNGVAAHLSITEQRSTEAERESKKIKLLELYSRELDKAEKTHFEAIITETRNHGLFIELTDSLLFGFVHVSTMLDDIYQLNIEGNALVGRKSRRCLAVGQKIKVTVYKVDRFKRQVDFLWVPEGSPHVTCDAPLPAEKSVQPRKDRSSSQRRRPKKGGGQRNRSSEKR